MLRALIVEDDKAQQMLYNYKLKEWGFKTESAYNGKEAIHYLKNNIHPHLIVLDMKMPEANGLEVLKFLETYRDIHNVHVVIATANPLTECAPYIEQLPKIDYLLKPMVLRDLEKVMDELIARHS